MPSKLSIELHQYYGNPQNSFWRILFSLFNITFTSDYNNKKLLTIDNHIAIWDVCYGAIRKGSLDSAIKEENPNTIDELVSNNPSIRLIAFNGQRAAKLYKKYFPNFENINYLTLLSTSPANAKYTFEEKLKNWDQIKQINYNN